MKRDGNGPALHCMRSTGMHLNAALTLQMGTQACGIGGLQNFHDNTSKCSCYYFLMHTIP